MLKLPRVAQRRRNENHYHRKKKKKKKKDVRSSWKVTFDQHIIIIYKKANAKLNTLSSVVKYICKSPTIVLS